MSLIPEPMEEIPSARLCAQVGSSLQSANFVFDPGSGQETWMLKMKTAYKTLIYAFAGLASVFLLGANAHAGCGLYTPMSNHSSWNPQLNSPRLVPAAFLMDVDENDHEPSMVGTWKEHWISYGSDGIPDGTEVDAGYAQWHSDGTEINISGLRSPLTGDVCLGEWIKTGARTYRMNHFGISYDSTGLNLVGPARIQQWITLDAKGNSTTGRFSIDQYDEEGNLLAHVQGKLSGTRVTMETGFQKVE